MCFTALQQTKERRRLTRASSRPRYGTSAWMFRRQRAGVKVVLKASEVGPAFPALPLKLTWSLFRSFAVKLSKVPLIQMQIK